MLWLSSTGTGRGQGILNYTVYSVLQTGSITPLITATQSLETGSLQPAGRLEFAFGFATEERPVPNVFFDAVTITLQNAGGTATAVYLTVDANSLTWVPATPGAVPLSLDDCTMTPLNLQDQTRPWAFQTAYWVSVPVPLAISGSAYLYLDLFDNGNALQSQAWISQVPEPSYGALLVLGGALCLWRMRRWG